MLSISTNPQHNEKNNHYLPGCFLHRIDRRFLCRPSLQPETHITRQHTTRRRQRRNSSRLRFQRRHAEIYAVTVSKDAALTTNAQLAGWSLQLTGGSGTQWTVIPLKGIIPAKGYYLIALAGGDYAYDLPKANA